MIKETMTKISKIRQLIAEKGVTKTKVSERCGIAPSTLSKYLSGKGAMLSGATVDRVIAYLEAVNTNEV